MNEQRIEANRRRWDTLADLHVVSDFYDVPGFMAGRRGLDPLEVEGVGEVQGRSLLHLQCHFGLGTLDWSRRGARAVGLDYSERAIEHARRLAAELQLDTRFVCADVTDALPALAGERFDIVFTSYGTICWLPDLTGWARTIAGALKPGGRFFMADTHPVLWMFDENSPVDNLRFTYRYFDSEACEEEEQGSYAVPEADFRAPSYCWQHTFQEIFQALLAAGLRITSLEEHSFIAWKSFGFMVQDEKGFWRMPEDSPDIPLMFSLTAELPRDITPSRRRAGAAADCLSGDEPESGCPLTIRPATPDDAPLLSRQRAAMFRDMGVTEEAGNEMILTYERYVPGAMARGELVSWLACCGEEVVGGLSAVLQNGSPMFLNPSGRTGRLINMYVRPEWRSRGVARALLRHAMNYLAERGIEMATLVASNQGRPLYASEGFQAVAEMKKPLP